MLLKWLVSQSTFCARWVLKALNCMMIPHGHSPSHFIVIGASLFDGRNLMRIRLWIYWEGISCVWVATHEILVVLRPSFGFLSLLHWDLRSSLRSGLGSGGA